MTVGILAHGLGGRTDLPLNGVAAILGGGAAVAASFFALTKLWSRPWLDPDAGRALPTLDTRGLRATARVIVLVLTALVVAVALSGPAETSVNLAPWVLYVTFWVGIALVSALFGPVWRAVNPLRTVHWALRLRRRQPMPSWLGYWPAAVWLTAFVWLELVVPNRSDPRLAGVLILAYAAINLVAAAVYGDEWFARGDGFEVYSTLLAKLSPLGRRHDGTLLLRNPLAGLVTSEPGNPGCEPGLAAVACVLIGATAFDGLTRTTYWQAVPHSGSPVTGTVGLLVAIGFVSALYVAAMRLSGVLSGVPGRPLPALFAATLLPIALGYTVAHYFSFFLLEGQTTFILASDPFGTGLDLFGTRQRTVDYTWVTPTVTATVQINAIVLGHIAGTAAAHDQALRLFSARQARWGQVPVVVAMVLLTCTGLLLLLSG